MSASVTTLRINVMSKSMAARTLDSARTLDFVFVFKWFILKVEIKFVDIWLNNLGRGSRGWRIFKMVNKFDDS